MHLGGGIGADCRGDGADCGLAFACLGVLGDVGELLLRWPRYASDDSGGGGGGGTVLGCKEEDACPWRSFFCCPAGSTERVLRLSILEDTLRKRADFHRSR